MPSKLHYYCSVGLCALISGLSVMFPSYVGIFAWISLIPLCYVLYQMANNGLPALRKYYLLGLYYFFIFYSVTFHFFIYMYPLDFTGINNFFSILVIIVAWFGLSLLQALISAVFFILFGLLVKLGAFKKRPFLMPTVFAAIYVALEWFQTIGWWGVPWARLSLSQSELLPIINTASLFGSYLISGLVAFTSAMIAYMLFERKSTANRSRTRQMLFSLIALAAFSLNLIIGTVIYTSQSDNESPSEAVRVAVIQGNFSSKDESDISKYDFLPVYKKYTKLAKEQGADLVIWPETALPFYVKPDDNFAMGVSRIAREYEVNIIFGALRYHNEMIYNSAYYVHKDGSFDEQIYSKRHLVPFGEYLPLREIIEVVLPFMADINMLSSDMTPGESTAIFNVDGLKVGSLICFDSIYETLTRDSVKDGAELLVLGTNDSWFSDSAAIYLHNNQARFRAIESGRYLARSAVTGVSTIISSRGEILGKTEPLTEDFLVCDVYKCSSSTLYTRIGDVVVVVSFIYIISLIGYEMFTKLSKKQKEERI